MGDILSNDNSPQDKRSLTKTVMTCRVTDEDIKEGKRLGLTRKEMFRRSFEQAYREFERTGLL
jgi:hypothetical protein